MNKLYIIHDGTKFEIFYTLFPFIISNTKTAELTIRLFNKNSFSELSGDIVVFTRIFKNHFEDIDYVRSVIKTFKRNFRKVIFLDDSDGADSTHFEFIDLLDGYFKGKILKDESLYTKRIYGRQIFSDYYAEKFSVRDKTEDIREPVPDTDLLEKIHPAFNIGYGIYPKLEDSAAQKKLGYLLSKTDGLSFLKPYYLFKLKKLIRKLSRKVQYSSKALKISARFRYSEYPKSIGYQRYLLEGLIKNDARFLTGLVPKDQYESELKSVIATLSPFGYGEVCFRDFEAIINGSLLIKPAMDHLETTPDIYIPNETYVPIKWDGSDLLDKVDDILSNPKPYFRIIENSRNVYRQELKGMQQFTDSLLIDMIKS